MKKLIITLMVLFARLCVFAQDSPANTIQEATGLRAGNKIYVVLAVAVTILIGLLLYVIRLDRKIAKLEERQS